MLALTIEIRLSSRCLVLPPSLSSSPPASCKCSYVLSQVACRFLNQPGSWIVLISFCPYLLWYIKSIGSLPQIHIRWYWLSGKGTAQEGCSAGSLLTMHGAGGLGLLTSLLLTPVAGALLGGTSSSPKRAGNHLLTMTSSQAEPSISPSSSTMVPGNS